MSINQIIIKEIENETGRELPLYDLDDYLCASYEVDDGSNVVGLYLISEGLTQIPSNVFRLNNLRTLCLAHNSRGHEQLRRNSGVNNHIRGNVSA